MVGLSVILENYKDIGSQKSPQVINKGIRMIKPLFSFSKRNPLPNLYPTSGFLDHCFLCKQKLLPGKDIYMYKGDRGFCSVECRCRQIFMDEEECAKIGSTREYNCSLAAASSSSSSSSPSSSSSGSGKRARNRINAFAYRKVF